MTDPIQTFPPELETRVKEEEHALSATLSSLTDSLSLEQQKLYHHSKEARSLTSQLVNTQARHRQAIIG